MTEKPFTVAFGDYPLATKLRNLAGQEFAFVDVKPVTKTFKPMLDHQAYDIGEMASVTLLQGKVYGHPVHMLPITMLARFQQRTLVGNTDFGVPDVTQLEGKTVGVRSYAQTTGVWVRGLLSHNYGVDLRKIRWISFEDAHVAEFRDPAGVTRAPEGSKVAAFLQEGKVDAAIIGNELPKDDARLQPILANPEADAFAWYERTGVVPINHVMVVSESMLDRHPDKVRDFYRLAMAAKADGGGRVEQGIDMNPIGFEALETSLQFLIEIAREQGLIPSSLAPADLFDPRVREICT
ncbi:substrate-binding domain-containing protein [Mangrovibrevibacter kandeliae]|uniref:phosphate ABC transporter substrate-binding protein n=1 Tax=Mangrovibrevibacter kandeliae TaxID=2968473 RepID=UPI002118930B|nr:MULTISPECIES: phosphate ABC transporter substrate-binding protein [unclassified Aurantimonas]MCQ8781568.1 phosphate ABC transporter substrate-binding protein [Aurantimonas sp. CSK15Z-1]MCW4114342.1 phosphate ABC transporter substrate-binding protein [Aurantimonas sp. MSK8Z-1]